MAASPGYKIEAALRRAKAIWAGFGLTPAQWKAIEKGPDLCNADYLSSLNAANTALVNIVGVDASNNVVFGQAPKNSLSIAVFSVTTAAIKAGTAVVIAATTGYKIRVHHFNLLFAGSAATATTIRLSDTNSSQVDVAVIPVALAADGDRVTSICHIAANGTLTGAGASSLVVSNLSTALTVSKGLQIRDVTANTLTGTTAVSGVIFYDLTA